MPTTNGPASPPPLPVIGVGLAHLVIPGTALFFLTAAVLAFFTDDLRETNAMIWLWSALVGGILGLIGLSIYAWQRAAARKGTRGSQSMALDETFGSGPAES